jgi:pyruvate/2-oxoglutarate dehydrogenase complex dihydrolipoamide acyltransferase (E2) component
VIQRDGVATGGHAPTFQTTFAPVNIVQKPVVYQGEVAIRTILHMVVSVDHYLIDGMDVQRAIATLRGFMEKPTTLLD